MAGNKKASHSHKTVSEWPIAELKEGEHYYWENDLMVLTEAYHLARGRCCGSACRHCPYGHINVARH